jgi:hypothetical protein
MKSSETVLWKRRLNNEGQNKIFETLECARSHPVQAVPTPVFANKRTIRQIMLFYED